ncbi:MULTISPECIES: hypothetical protein [unclassified Bradyrhizobium]|uniref:hypothetical protein n=1 Tax=unclassified Bradyrhizobium TaxID=2631580 RepID=UPI001FFAE7C8|nr:MULTISPECIES: hypothetical protein [unclassified Bradyrhizobium]
MAVVQEPVYPHHFLFGQRLEVLKERSGRGPAHVVVALPDGRPRAVRIASTDLGETLITSRLNAADLPRISARTLILLMQHLSASLSLLDEKVIRDDPPTASRSRCVSTTADVGKSTRPTFRACGRIYRPRRKPRSLKSSPRCCGECKRFPARPEGD